MKDNNVMSLSKLSAFCRYAGIVSVFLGILVLFVDILNMDWVHMQVGLFIFVSGYTYLKIGTKLSSVLFDERTELN